MDPPKKCFKQVIVVCPIKIALKWTPLKKRQRFFCRFKMDPLKKVVASKTNKYTQNKNITLKKAEQR